MPLKIEELKQREKHLINLVRIGNQYVEAGSLRNELETVKARLSAVSVDTPTEDLMEALQREAALTLKIASAEAELKRIEGEVTQLTYLQNQSVQLANAQRHVEQERIRTGQERIAEIDALLTGTKTFPPLPIAMGASSSDYQDVHNKRRENLKRERDQLVAEVGTPEEYEICRAKARTVKVEAILAGKEPMPELSYEIQQHAHRYDVTGKDGYLQKQRASQRRELEAERTRLIASIEGEDKASQVASSTGG